MLFTNVAVFLIILYLCVAQKDNAESAKESRGLDLEDQSNERRWSTSRDSHYQRVVSSARDDSDKSKKAKRLSTNAGHSRNRNTIRQRRISSESDKRRMPTIPTTTNHPQTMSYALYNHFRPLEQDLPQDDILPFLDFGRKLTPIVPTPGNVNSIENKSSVSKLHINITPTDNEAEHGEMDLNYERKAIERNSVPRGRLHTSPILSNLYRIPPSHTSRMSENVINTDCVTASGMTKKHAQMQSVSRKNRSICGATDVETIAGADDPTSKLKEVELISNPKTPYKSSELKLEEFKSGISAEPSNVKAIFHDLDLVTSENNKYSQSSEMPVVNKTITHLKTIADDTKVNVHDITSTVRTKTDLDLPPLFSSSTEIPRHNKTGKVRLHIKPVNTFRHVAVVKKSFHNPLFQARTRNHTSTNNTKSESRLEPVITTFNPFALNSSISQPKNPKILSTAVVTSVSVQEDNTSVNATAAPTLNYTKSTLNATGLTVTVSNVTVSNLTVTNINVTNYKIPIHENNVGKTHDEKNKPLQVTTVTTESDSLIATALPQTNSSTVNTTPPPPVTTTIQTTLPDITERSLETITDNPFINTTFPTSLETTTSTPLIIPTIPSQKLENSNETIKVLHENNAIENNTGIIDYTTELPEQTTLDSYTIIPEEMTTYETPLQPQIVNPLPTGNGSGVETAVVKEEKNNLTAVLTSENTQFPHNWVSENDVEVAYQQGIGFTTYVLVFLSVVPIVLGAAVAGRFLVLHSRKKVLDQSEYSSEYNRSPLGIGTGAASPLPTKLPRVPSHNWEMEKNSANLPTVGSRWEFPREKLRLQTLLGQGNFGQVWKAEADDISGHEGLTRLVAVKTVKESANMREREDLLRELGIMQDLGSHPNVVTLLGCCTEKEPYFLIMEYVMYGKLLAFLRDHRTRAHYYNFSDVSDALTSRDLTVFGYCVARGMDYLSNKGIIHRDLAARNVLVDHNKLCKIADFGMSRNVQDTGQIYEQRQSKGALPIRWMAPESLHFSLFTHKSDVWSFGILMWEIVTLGSTPYATMGAREVMRRVREGYRLERPSHCRPELFRVITKCWHSDPNKRPTFAELKQEIAHLLNDAENGGGYVDLESLADEIKQHNSSSLQKNH